MDLALLRPADVVEEFDGVQGHVGSGVALEGFIGFAHAAVVEDESGVFVALGVREVFCLALPGGFEGAEAHYPLLGEGLDEGVHGGGGWGCEG